MYTCEYKQQEKKDECGDGRFRSEPLRLFLHGVPGAGKTQTLLWIREFLEQVCAWTHGIDFVFLASQNTMAALIGGYTLHSFHKLAYKQKDGTVATQTDKHKDISSKYLRYQSLRFMFIDEMNTASLDVLAEIGFNTSTHIRERSTWSLRSKDYKRPFGGLNVMISGDAWQFPPVDSGGATAVFANPLSHQKSSIERMAAMFWTKDEDSLNSFCELTKERRCKDVWLSHVLKGARHGNLHDASYCFLHGFPTKHPGSWDPIQLRVACGEKTCAELTAL